VNRVAKWMDSMEIRVEKKLATENKWSKVSSQKKIDCGRMLVNVR
jgi:hypothetical protein